MQTLDEPTYDALAAKELYNLLEQLDTIDDDRVEAELQSGILTLEFWDDTRYVINSHRAARQIWMAAERSAWHFDWDGDTKGWVSHKTGDELWVTLRTVLSGKLGRPVQLSRPPG